MDRLSPPIDSDAADSVGRLNDFNSALRQTGGRALNVSAPPCFVLHRLGIGMQDHRVKPVTAIDRQEPIGVPNLGRHPEPAILICAKDLLRDFLFEWRRWKTPHIAKIGPDIASQLAGVKRAHGYLFQ